MRWPTNEGLVDRTQHLPLFFAFPFLSAQYIVYLYVIASLYDFRLYRRGFVDALLSGRLATEGPGGESRFASAERLIGIDYQGTCMSNQGRARTVQSVATAIEIIKHVRELEGATITELADRVDLSQASVHAHLTTLKESGFIVQNGHTYDVGPELIPLGEYVRNHSDLYQASKEQVEKLATETAECAHLAIEHHGQMVIVYERFGSEAVGTEYHDIKRQEPYDALHCTGVGKCILGELPPGEVEEILEARGLPEYTEQTITDRETLMDELAEYREHGYAFADEELIHGIRAVAAPILGPDGGVEGAIAVTGPATRLRGERFREDLPRTVMNAANICEVNLQTATIRDAT